MLHPGPEFGQEAHDDPPPILNTGVSRRRINAVNKGRRNEQKTELLFKLFGYEVHTTVRGSRKGSVNDLFGLWDHICFSPHLKVPVLVQTKSNEFGAKKKYLEHVKFAEKFRQAGVFLVVVWHDYVTMPSVYVAEVNTSGDVAFSKSIPEIWSYALFGCKPVELEQLIKNATKRRR